MQQQAVRGREHDFEKHEQVEQVGRQKRAVDAHELQLQQGMKMHARTVPACARKQQGGQAHHGGNQQHHGG